ncbi:hypothetical protein AB0O07_26745 [Streptomyces sp. NPDC093085]|uniref:hypothetical protein n=1 Tax=Streptomyces sp. NPDC093085 TaxID=3155068 RepID=UPI00342B17B6
MIDIVTVKLHVQDRPDIVYRERVIITPEIITFRYRLDALGPVNGICPARAEVYGPTRLVDPGPYSFGNPPTGTTWFYRGHPEHWPAWLIDLGAEHRPNPA